MEFVGWSATKVCCRLGTKYFGCETMRNLSDLTHGGVRGPFEEKGVVKITQIKALEVEKINFHCGYMLVLHIEQVDLRLVCVQVNV